MTSPTPWSVKGIDPKAREVAKDLARRSGMTLGEWLNRMILEDDVPEEVTSETHFGDRRSERPAERPLRGFYEPVGSPQAAPRQRYEVREHPGDETSRMALLMDRLASRLEGSEARTSQAIIGVEHSVRQAVARIEAAERDQLAVSARFEGAVSEIADAQNRLAEGLRNVEAEVAEPRSAQAMRALEQALGKVAHHVYDGEGKTRELIEAVEARVERVEAAGGANQDAAGVADAVVGRLAARLAEAEARTGDALESLRASFAALDGRLCSVESGGSPGAEQRLERLATDLTQRVESARAEIAQKLTAPVSDERFDRMESRLKAMADHVAAAEQRSAEAIDKIGREVLTVAESMNQRVRAAEQRSAEAIDQVGGEVARIASAMETRLGRTDSVHAEALERLGGEIARITERLGERIGAAERRSAQAVDEVGEQIARVTDKLNQRHEQSSANLLERIRQSEERTTRLLEEARDRIDQRLADTRARSVEPAPQAAVQPSPPFGPQTYADFGPAEPDTLKDEAYVPPMAAAFPSGASLMAERSVDTESFDAADFEAADGFEPVAEPKADAFADEEPLPVEPQLAAIAPTEAAPDEPGLDPPSDDRDWAAEGLAAQDEVAAELAAAEAWAPAEADPWLRRTDPEPPEPDAQSEFAGDEEEPLARSMTTREVIEQARAAARAAAQSGDKRLKAKASAQDGAPAPRGGSLFSGFGLIKPKRKAGSTLQTALLVAGGAAALSMAAAGLVVMEGRPGGAPPKRVADALKADEAPAASADAPAFGTAPRAAVALSPQPVTQGPSVAPDAGAEAATLYAEAVRALEAQEAGGLAALRKAANLGHAPAQLYLARLHEAGEGGVKKDLAEARRWTERAAEGGDRKAMHNLALYYFEGAGDGPRNTTIAAHWFRRAADLGLVDSQYNLGRLYEEGIGVSQNAAEAYKWYLIAARSGDAESRASGQRVRAKLSAAAQGVVERTAAGYRPAVAAPALAGQSTPAVAVATAQRALSRLGYYQGPTDGAASPALRMAVAAYQRDKGMAPTGALDETTVSRLSVFTR